jgi:hypothetical protein
VIPLLVTSLALAAGETHRFALVAGANDGGSGRVELRYAANDARSVAQVLGALGGVAPSDTVLLLEPSHGDLHGAIADMRSRVAAAEARGDRTELVVYYSGHSDEDGLLLGGDRYAYAALRSELDGIPADVKLVVLDSCASGAMLREKGGVVRPAFLSDQSADVTGYAYLTSSSEDEAAQESDRIGGSFFTHYLVSGLRGAADYTNDGRVSLNEAYQFAYTETLARTERTQGGAQHAKQELRVAGSGDLVLTDLSATSAALVLGDDLDGRLYVRDERGHLVAELYKPAGRSIALGLGPGSYSATLERDGQLLETTFELRDDETLSLAMADFRRISGEATVARGGDAEVRDVPFVFGIFPGLELPYVQEPRRVRSAVSLGVHGSERLDGAAVALAGTYTMDEAKGLQIGTGFNVAGGEMRGAQLTAGFNWASGDVTGTQLAAGFNVASGVSGLQASSGLNVAGGYVDGAQLTAGLNVAEGVGGVQAGVANAAVDVKGAQIGLLNVAKKVRGTQIGLLNIGDFEKGTPIGLLSINPSGYNHLWLYGSDTEAFGLGATYGGSRVYTMFQAGWEPGSLEQLGYVALLGMGLHTKIGPVFADTDISGGSYQDFEGWEGGVLVRARVIGGVGLERLSVFGGPTFTMVPVTWDDPGSPTFLPTGTMNGIPAWFGFTAGVRI